MDDVHKPELMTSFVSEIVSVAAFHAEALESRNSLNSICNQTFGAETDEVDDVLDALNLRMMRTREEHGVRLAVKASKTKKKSQRKNEKEEDSDTGEDIFKEHGEEEAAGDLIMANDDDDDDVNNNNNTLKVNIVNNNGPSPFQDGDPSNNTLFCIQYRELEKQERKRSKAYAQAAMMAAPYRRHDFGKLNPDPEPGQEEPEMMKEEEDDEGPLTIATDKNDIKDEVILNVTVCEPHKGPLSDYEKRLGRLLSIDSAMLMLGRQTLSDLARSIPCKARSMAACPDLSLMPVDEAVAYAEGRDDADRKTAAVEAGLETCFIFMEDKFYDSPKTDGIPFSPASESVIAWGEKNEFARGKFTTASMANTKLADLSIRVGRPYLFRHAFCCDHVLIFSEISLAHSDLPQTASDYPLSYLNTIHKRDLCLCCRKKEACLAVYGSDLPLDTSGVGFFCSRCYESLLFDRDGEKITDFKAFNYVNRPAVQ